MIVARAATAADAVPVPVGSGPSTRSAPYDREQQLVASMLVSKPVHVAGEWRTVSTRRCDTFEAGTVCRRTSVQGRGGVQRTPGDKVVVEKRKTLYHRVCYCGGGCYLRGRRLFPCFTVLNRHYRETTTTLHVKNRSVLVQDPFPVRTHSPFAYKVCPLLCV